MYETRAKILPLKEWFTLFFAAWLMLWFTVFPPINLNRNLNFPTHYLSDNIDKSAAMTLITRGFGKNGQGVPNDGFKGLGGSLNGLIPAKAFSGNGILDTTYFSQDWLVQPIINTGGTTDEAFEAISDAKYATKGGGTGAKFKDQQNLDYHFNNHKDDFGAKTPAEYAQMADDFTTGSKGPNVQERTRVNGDVVRFDATTGEFGVVSKDGIIRTYYKPAPRSPSNPRGYDPNLYSSPQDYYDKSP